MNEKVIWDYLYKVTGNAYGTAAIMGNLMAESSLNPANATGKNKTPNYVQDADNGTIDFVHDGVAFGIVQWCYYSRKQVLYDMAKSRGTSVGDLNLQLEYLVSEMSKSYKTAWTAVTQATNIREASDVVMLRYEKPATTTEAAKQKRADYGKKFYDMFVGEKQEPSPAPAPVTPEPTPAPSQKSKYVVATANVNIRAGNGKTYAKVGSVKNGAKMKWIATSKDGWHAVQYNKGVYWVSGEFSEVVEL